MKEEISTLDYPVIIRKESDGYIAVLPDFDRETQGTSVEEATAMAKDLLGMLFLEYFKKDENLPISESGKFELQKDDILVFVGIEIIEFLTLSYNQSEK